MSIVRNFPAASWLSSTDFPGRSSTTWVPVPAPAIVAGLVLTALLLAACDAESNPERESAKAPAAAESAGDPAFQARLEWQVRDGDDLLSAGLGLAGLRAAPPALEDPASPEPRALRRLVIHSQWQSLVDLSPDGGFGEAWGSLPAVPGREFHALDRLDGAGHPFRILLQLPDAFDPSRPCLVAAPSSGSRGIYGAVPVAGPAAFARNCGVVYTDKGAGTDVFDFETDTGVGLDGIRQPRSEGPAAFEPASVGSGSPQNLVAMKHAHSGDHPEARWGEHVLRSVMFAREILTAEFDDLDTSALITMALGLSNGGGAVLQAAALDREGLLDGVVAVAPNIHAPGARPLYDYATLAALYQPCVLAGAGNDEWPLSGLPALEATGMLRCESLADAGLLDVPEPEAARQVLERAGFPEEALSQSALLVSGDLWRAVAVSYASSYLRRGAEDMPCGFAITHSATAQQQALWYALSPGVAPGAGIEIHDSLASGADPAFPGLVCLRGLFEDGDEPLRDAIRALESSPGRHSPPVVVVHGRQDGLIPEAFTSEPWVAAARDAGLERLAYWQVDGAQHFDALLAVPGVHGRYGPLQAYTEAALDGLWSYLADGADFPADRLIRVRHPGAGQALEAAHLGLE